MIVSVYGPSRSWVTEYTPSLLVVVFVSSAVSRLVATTVAPLMTPPVESVTVPVIVAYVVWAPADATLSPSRTMMHRRHRSDFGMAGRLLVKLLQQS